MTPRATRLRKLWRALEKQYDRNTLPEFDASECLGQTLLAIMAFIEAELDIIEAEARK